MAEWKRRFWKNTLSSYAGVAVRLVLGLILFRQMFENLDGPQFGFWALLWSLFGYGILLDFGFGFTAQKAVAEKTASGDLDGLSKMLATILWTFVALGVGLMLVMFFLRDGFLTHVDVTADDRQDFEQAYLVFFIGMAVMFPLGLFPEILRGLQRIDLANWVSVGSVIINFIGIVAGIHLGWSFTVLMAIAVSTSALPNIVAAFMAMKRLKGVSLAPKHFEWKAVRSQMSFSVAAYIIAFSNLLMAKSDQLVLSMTLGVSAVAIYQAGYKMGEMLDLFSTQLQSALSPAAANLGSQGDKTGLIELLLRSSRLTFLLITPCYVLTACYLDVLIRLLTGLDEVPWETFWVGQALILAIYSSQLTNSCSKRILMMCGHEKPLLWISVGDALVNVALSVTLVLAFNLGVLGVALGTLVPTIVIGWFIVLPLTMKRLELSPARYIKFLGNETIRPILVFAAVLAVVLWRAPMPDDGGFLSIMWRGALVGLPFAVLSLPILKGMTR